MNKGMITGGMFLGVLGVLILMGIGLAVWERPMGEMEKKDTGTALTREEAEHMAMEGRTKEGGAEWTKEEMEVMEKAEMMGQGTGTMMLEKVGTTGSMGGVYAGTMRGGVAKAPLLDFTKADYDASVKSGKLVTLYFYANWCPLCIAEFPKMIEAFNTLPQGAEGNVIGFRVNYKDNETDADEKALASEFGVSYQHTKVFVKNGIRILKAPDSWDTARYLFEMSKAI